MNEIIKEFYNKTPYPYVPSIMKYRAQKNFYENMCLRSGVKISPQPGILVLGCGAVTAGTLARAYPKGEIYAVDISDKTIEKARQYSGSYRDRIKWFVHDIENRDLVNIFGRKFDFIHCTGVLQLPENTNAAVKNVSELLKENGIVRVLEYSKGARYFIEFARQAFNRAGLKNTEEIKEYLFSLPSEHPFRFTLATYGETLKKEGVQDGFLVPQLSLNYLSGWKEIFNNNGLDFSYIDQIDDDEYFYNEYLDEIFPEKLKGKIKEMNVYDQVTLLEALGEWRTDFTGVLIKLKNKPVKTIYSFDKKSELINKTEFSMPRTYLFNETKKVLKPLFDELKKDEFEYIINHLYRRYWISGLKGLRLRYKWKAWNDMSRINTTHKNIYLENLDKLHEDYNEEIIELPPMKDWCETQWSKKILNW